MGGPPQAFMIYQEELKKANLEKKRLEKEYEEKILELNRHLSLLKEKMASQEEMMKSALRYAASLEDKLGEFKEVVEKNQERNSSGYH